MRRRFAKKLFVILLLILILILILMFSKQAMANQITGNAIDQEIYGEDLMKPYEEAQILWVRESFINIFDYEGGKNKPVVFLSDEKILAILKNHQARLRMGADDVDFTPYIERVKGINIEQPTLINETNKTNEKPVDTGKKEELESKKIIKKYVPKVEEVVEEKKPHIEKPTFICKASFNPLSLFSVSLPVEIKPYFLC